MATQEEEIYQFSAGLSLCSIFNQLLSAGKLFMTLILSGLVCIIKSSQRFVEAKTKLENGENGARSNLNLQFPRALAWYGSEHTLIVFPGEEAMGKPFSLLGLRGNKI